MTEAGSQTSGTSRSYWLPPIPVAIHKPLARNLDVDVLVIGAGITGLSAAYTLTKAGRSVAVLDDGLIASGETGRTSAHLTSYLDGGYRRINQLYGLTAAQLIAKS